MIFVTVGTQLPFDRLLRGVDTWAQAHPAMRVVAQTGQIGAAGYTPRHMTCHAKLMPDAFDRLCREARLMVSHAGTGSLLAAHAAGTPILMMPRKAALGEHRNDHQKATADGLLGLTGVSFVHEEENLPGAIDALLAAPPAPPVLNDFADDRLIGTLRDVIFSGRAG